MKSANRLLLCCSILVSTCVISQFHLLNQTARSSCAQDNSSSGGGSSSMSQQLTTQNVHFCDGKGTSACTQAQEEIASKLAIEEKLKSEMIQHAMERAKQNEYRRNDHAFHQQQHVLYFEKVQHAIHPLEPSFRPKQSWRGNSFSHLSIMGFPKAGTSQLFKILTTHPRAQEVFKRKEFCVDHGHFLDYTDQSLKMVNDQTLLDLRKKLWRYRRHSYQKRLNATDDNMLLVNACLQPHEMEYHAAYTQLPNDAKLFLIFRDPADWLWASWNFWVDKNLDLAKPIDHDWASSAVHYRSPELFHELILSRGRIRSAGLRFAAMREQTVSVGRRLIHVVGKSNVLFLKNEDLRPENIKPTGTLHSIAKFSGLDEAQFDDATVLSRTNCNDNKGYNQSCGKGSAAYAISEGREMLQRTREFIYIQFHEECKVWAEEFGVVYRACLEAVPLEDSSSKLLYHLRGA